MMFMLVLTSWLDYNNPTYTTVLSNLSKEECTQLATEMEKTTDEDSSYICIER